MGALEVARWQAMQRSRILKDLALVKTVSAVSLIHNHERVLRAVVVHFIISWEDIILGVHKRLGAVRDHLVARAKCLACRFL